MVRIIGNARAPGGPEPTLAEVKAVRLEALAARRKLATEAFSVNGMALRLDPDTENAISKAIMSLERQPEGTAISWEVSRGVFAPFNLPTLHAIGDAAFAHVQACFTNVASITGQVLAASDVQAVANVDLDIGWPGQGGGEASTLDGGAA